MADKQISALPEATSIGTSDLFAVQQNNQAKKVAGQTLIVTLTATSLPTLLARNHT